MKLPMLTKSIKWISIAALLAAFFARSAGYQLALQLLVTAGALWVVAQAVRTGRHFWTATFIAIAVLYNPILPIPLPTFLSFGLGLVCLWAFAASLLLLKATEMPPLASVTGRTRKGRFSPGQWNVVS